jgi:hypothetical protein
MDTDYTKATLRGRLLKALFDRKIFPTERFLHMATNYLSEEEALKQIANLPKQRFGSMYDLNLYSHDLKLAELFPSVMAELRLPSGKSEVNPFADPPAEYSLWDRQVINYVMSEVSQPTQYLSPYGTVKIPFDVDRAKYMNFLLLKSEATRALGQVLVSKLIVYRDLTFFKEVGY